MRPLLLGLATVSLLAGCSSEDSAGDETLTPDTGITVVEDTAGVGDTNPPAAADEFTIQIRPVLTACFEVTPSPSDSAPLSLPAPSAVPANETAYIPVAGTTQYCQVGPSQGDGTIFEPSAQAQSDAVAGWVVQAPLRPGAAGEDIFNALASQCYQHVETCPTGQIAIVIDGVAISVASVQVPEFSGNVQISGNFSEDDARQLARRINAGALPG